MESFENMNGIVNLHISKLRGQDVEIFFHSEDFIIEIRQDGKKMTRLLDKDLDPVETIRDFLRTVVVDCQEKCDDYYIFIETKELSYLDIFEMDGVEFDFEKCCVCLLSTYSKTPCNHALCLVCLPKCKKCPYCRASF